MLNLQDISIESLHKSLAFLFQTGSWFFQINSVYTDRVDLIVTSMAANRNVEPMVVESGMSNLDAADQQPIVVYAKVGKENSKFLLKKF